jgi:hypothetical protein
MGMARYQSSLHGKDLNLRVKMGKVVPVSLGPAPKFFSERNRDRYLKFFLAGIGTKDDWSRSCLLMSIMKVEPIIGSALSTAYETCH